MSATAVFKQSIPVLITSNKDPKQDPIFTQAITINIKQNTDVDIKKTLAGTFVLNNFGYLPVTIQLACVSTLGKSKVCNDTNQNQAHIQNVSQKVLSDYLKIDTNKSTQILQPYSFTLGSTTYRGYILGMSQQNSQRYPGVSLVNLYIVGQRV